MSDKVLVTLVCPDGNEMHDWPLDATHVTVKRFGPHQEQTEVRVEMDADEWEGMFG